MCGHGEPFLENSGFLCMSKVENSRGIENLWITSISRHMVVCVAQESGRAGILIIKFLSSSYSLSPQPILDWISQLFLPVYFKSFFLHLSCFK